jgi:hypothetical protein
MVLEALLLLQVLLQAVHCCSALQSQHKHNDTLLSAAAVLGGPQP